MLTHRRNCREYQTCYTKVLCPKPPAAAVNKARQLEEVIDVFNLILLRERASWEAEKLAKKEAEAKAARGWLGWVWGSPQDDPNDFTASIGKKNYN